MSTPTSPTRSGPTLSIVIPLLNEEAVLPQTYACLKEHLNQLGESHEIVFVDDGSTDRSRAILAGLALRDPAVRVVLLSRNFGHEMATTAGLHHARGQAAIVMDADLQDPPDMIATFLERWREGYQVVYGVRRSRQGETVLKRLTSYLFYRLLGRISDVAIPADTGDFRLLDRRVLDVYQQLKEDPRLFRGLVSWVGFRQIGVPFDRRSRAGGQTKYRYSRLLRLALDTVTAFSTLPALGITVVAGGCATLSVLATAAIVLFWAVGLIRLQGWMWAGLGFLFLWNLQFMALAILGEYIVRTHRHTQGRPLFIVDRVIEGGARAVDGDDLATEAEQQPLCHPSSLVTS